MNPSLESGKIAQIQYLNEHDEVARAFFADAAKRQKHQTETTVRRAAELCHVEYWQMRGLFQKLGEIGLGTYIMGRRGGESRVKWLYPLTAIGKAANGTAGSLGSINESTEEETDEDSEELGSSNLIEHSYKLRPGCDIRIRLPENLSSKEAERLAAWIRTLPFD